MNDVFARIRDEAAALLEQRGLLSGSGTGRQALRFKMIPGDGSGRRFFRVSCRGEPLAVGVLPPGSKAGDMAEFRAAVNIAEHLYGCGVPVPRVFGVAEEYGLILFEDLGDCKLHDQVRRDRNGALDYYRAAVTTLARMQVQGASGFKQEWCCDTPLYDRQVMVERESSYFLDAFWRQTLFADPVEGLAEELELLAERVMERFMPLFLHRDYQCRNLMIHRDCIRVIDFQGGRLGPPAYDIASLLIDPYASLPGAQQQELLDCYLDELAHLGEFETITIRESYPYLAVQRNLQIIGAFAYLSGRKHKGFFRSYILPALIILQNRLAETTFDDFPLLRKTVSVAIGEYRRCRSL